MCDCEASLLSNDCSLFVCPGWFRTKQGVYHPRCLQDRWEEGLLPRWALIDALEAVLSLRRWAGRFALWICGSRKIEGDTLSRLLFLHFTTRSDALKKDSSITNPQLLSYIIHKDRSRLQKTQFSNQTFCFHETNFNLTKPEQGGEVQPLVIHCK